MPVLAKNHNKKIISNDILDTAFSTAALLCFFIYKCKDVTCQLKIVTNWHLVIVDFFLSLFLISAFNDRTKHFKFFSGGEIMFGMCRYNNTIT